MDRFEAMVMFVAVADAGGFSAASRKTGQPLATVSRKVSELESHLKVNLLTRSARGVVLTESGQAYYRDCRGVLDALAEAERAAMGEYSVPRGELVITAPIVFGRLHLIPVIVAFLAEYSQVRVSLKLRDEILDLVENQIDLAVRISSLPDSSLIAKRVADIRHIICASPTYLAARGTPHHPADLAGHDGISGQSLASPEGWSFRIGKTVRMFPIRRRLAASTSDAVIEAAMAGAGLARALSYQIADAQSAGKLVTLLEDFEPEPVPLNFVYIASRRMPLKLRTFLDYAVPRLQHRLKSGTGSHYLLD